METVSYAWPLVALIGVCGLAIGSFLNVVIWRVPRGESVIRPRSACPSCAAEIAAKDNIPLLSWVLLHGRCRSCRARISWRYPAVEAVTGLGFVAITAWRGLAPELPALLFLSAVTVALAAIDIDVQRLPDTIVLPSIPVAIILIGIGVAADSGATGWWPLVRALIGGVVLFAVYFAIVFVYPAGMGMGDVKLAALIGLYLGWFGWGPLAVGWFAAFLLGGVFAVVLMVVRRAGRKSAVAFGPWMLVGAWVGMIAGAPISHAYLNLVT